MAVVKQRNEIWNARRPIALIRDPHKRLASAFISKFILFPEDEVLRSILDISETRLEDMTFRNFVNTLLTIPDEWLDAHFISQSAFLIRQPSDYQLLDMDSATFSTFIQERFTEKGKSFYIANEDAESRIFGPKLYSNEKDGVFVDTTVKKLRYYRENGLNLLKHNFYNDELYRNCAARFSCDANLYASTQVSSTNDA